MSTLVASNKERSQLACLIRKEDSQVSELVLFLTSRYLDSFCFLFSAAVLRCQGKCKILIDA